MGGESPIDIGENREMRAPEKSIIYNTENN